jgi:beta-lactamase regulating signal transducer with metallopeptidase domain
MAHWIHVAGWTLLHFLWQGTAIGVVAALGFWLLRASTPHVRYVLASAAMVTMLIAPIVTAVRLSSSASLAADPPRSASAIARVLMLSSDPATRESAASPAIRTPRTRPALDAVLPAMVMLWLAGVVLLQLRLLAGWWHVRGLHRASLTAQPSAWQARAQVLARVLAVQRLVHVVEARTVDIPSVIGWWRPVILLPIGALSGLTPAQADAILVHELAHIRRHDYLVNGLQHVAETLLFYHPAVWWVSRRMRIEREHCCDALVIRVCGDPIDYAMALVELEAGRGTRPALAVAATDGSLVQRIRMILSARPSHRRPLADAAVTACVVSVLVVVTGGGYSWSTRSARANLHASGVQSAAGADDVVVTVNGEAITDRDLRRRQEAAERDRNRPDASLSATLASAIDERLAVQRGRQLGYSMSDDQFRSVLRNLMAQNHLATDAALQDALAREQMTLADLRRNLESSSIWSRLQFYVARAAVTEDEAREYFTAHLEAFPLQTFELARPRVEELVAEANRGRDWERYLQTLRSAAVFVWQRADLQRAYELGRAQNTPQGRTNVPPAASPPPRAQDWQVYTTDHFDIFFTPGLNIELQRVERDAERAYQRLSADLRHDLGVRPNLVLFATDAERSRAVETGTAPGTGTQLRILLARDRPDDRFQADVTHEVTHAFEFDILPAAVLNDSPEWIREGLAEHEGEAWANGDDELLRGLVRTDSVPALSAFERPTERRLSYSLGHAAFDFIAARWGSDGIRRMLFALRQRQAADRGGLYQAVFGIPAEEFDQAFDRYLRERFPSASIVMPSPGNVADFCCPDYLIRMVDSIRNHWSQDVDAAGTTMVKFTVQRDGTLTDVSAESSSGHQSLDSNGVGRGARGSAARALAGGVSGFHAHGPSQLPIPAMKRSTSSPLRFSCRAVG